MTFNMDEYREQFAEEVIMFLSLCSDKDRNFLNVPEKKRTVEEYARLIYITEKFGFRKVMLKLAAEGEERMKKILDFLSKQSEENKVKWMEDFIAAIPIEELKKEAELFWATAR